MSKAYRCAQCGQLRDGSGWTVTLVDKGSEDYFTREDARIEVELCPDCAAPIRETLQAIAKTTHGE